MSLARPGHEPFLAVHDLAVHFPTEDGLVRAVDGVSFSVERGRTLAIVGESGSGKSVTAQAIMGLLDRRRTHLEGRIVLDGRDLLGLSREEARRLRGSRVAMIFQDPMSSLHPFYRIGRQLTEAILVHRPIGKTAARREAIEMLERVGIPAAARRIDDYPHQLSGGMRQRVMIAMALVNGPELLIADEPTTALDVTVQAQILELIGTLQRETGTTVILITHDLGIVADIGDEVAVLYGGRIVEFGATEEIFARPEMPYTVGLLDSVPRMDRVNITLLDPIPGSPPSAINLPPGCVFEPRCAYRDRVPGGACASTRPELLPATTGHLVRCHLAPETRRGIARMAISDANGGAA